MAVAHVGAGGWGYFPGGLREYARAFRFVEANATFYGTIADPRARRWRASVPEDFVFAVKASREVSHVDRLRASPPARERFADTIRIARILKAPFVVLETPPGVPLVREALDGLRALAALSDRGIRLGLEARAHRAGPLPRAAKATMEDLGVLDIVDLSQTAPRVRGETVYTRLFGPGPHNVYEFDDNELREIDRRGGDAVRAAFTFHGVRMYTDAARFLTFKRTGSFPPATSGRGLAALEEVLRPDTRFPATRDDLVREHGWKVIDADDRTRVHAGVLLKDLPQRAYPSLESVLDALAGAPLTPPGTQPVRITRGPDPSNDL